MAGVKLGNLGNFGRVIQIMNAQEQITIAPGKILLGAMVIFLFVLYA